MTDSRPYSKRESDLKITNIVEKNDAWSATILKAVEDGSKNHMQAMDDMREHEIRPILAQATKTNGRVNKLEERADKQDRWRSWLTGAAFILVPIFMAVASWIVLRQLSIDKQVQDTVDKRFNQYDVQLHVNN